MVNSFLASGEISHLLITCKQLRLRSEQTERLLRSVSKLFDTLDSEKIPGIIFEGGYF